MTGVPRCGSSWVGNVLSTARRVRYIYEPFNPTRPPFIPQHPYLKRHHVYLAADDEDSLVKRSADAAFKGKVQFYQFLRGMRWGYAWRTIRPMDRVVIKDPTGMLLSGWVAKNYKAQVLVIIRHPCAFASSIQRLGYSTNITDFLDQPRLIEDWLEPYESLLHDCQSSFWRQIAAFWACAYTVLNGQLQHHPDWLEVFYEDLCVNPHEEYAKLYDRLDLQHTMATTRMVEKTSSTADYRAKSTKRESQRMIDVWKERLTKESIKTIMEVVSHFQVPYYRD